MTRRNMLLGTLATGATTGVGDSEIAELIERTKVSEVVFIRGDMRRYLSLITHSDDYTLMAPFGGEPRRGFDTSSARLEKLSRFFRGGDGTVEVIESYASGGMVVLAMIARLRGNVGGLPEQEWPLRITQVYRRDAPGWRLVHRHADLLLRGISLEQAAALARG
ncbi:MAG TPA: nuclear transport factor 2 family protein [Myxococcaceae bacterium]|nr:nuclear transport factor 2 family protein [Myxococcaceae bacterium]